jgi:hypothetical protein
VCKQVCGAEANGFNGVLAVLGANLDKEGYKTVVKQIDENLWGFSIEPKAGIGQRSILIITREAPHPPRLGAY